jgi:hypothetical protein
MNLRGSSAAGGAEAVVEAAGASLQPVDASIAEFFRLSDTLMLSILFWLRNGLNSVSRWISTWWIETVMVSPVRSGREI